MSQTTVVFRMANGLAVILWLIIFTSTYLSGIAVVRYERELSDRAIEKLIEEEGGTERYTPDQIAPDLIVPLSGTVPNLGVWRI